MPRLSLSPVIVASMVLLLLCDPVLAFNAPLSDTAVREAYFLGQRRDETTAGFLDSYAKHLSVPKTGPYVSAVQVFTPYAQLVELSREHTVGYSAQQAGQDYRHRSDTIEVTVYIQLTPTYGAVIAHPVQKGSRSSEATTYSLRSPDFWRDFQFQMLQRDSIIEPRNFSGVATYTATDGEGGSSLSGATVWLEFDAKDLSSDDATVEVDTPDGQHVAVTFDLAKLR
jgi:hypothetical protein